MEILSSHSSITENVQNERGLETVPCILDGKFFAYSEKDSTNTKKVAICISCRPKVVKISGFNNSTSNFITHLRRKHGEVKYNEYQNYLKSMKKNKQPSKIPYRRQPDLQESEVVQRPPSELLILKDQFIENIMNFFINSMLPLQAIDDPFFKKMFEGFDMPARGLNIINSRKLEHLINEHYTQEIINFKIELCNVKVCTTGDIWSEKIRSFIGVTAHWLDSDLKRKSKTLACRRFPTAYSYDQLVPLLEAVHVEFGLDCQKVLSTVTIHGNNFIINEVKVKMESFENSVNLDNPIDGEKYNSEMSSILEKDPLSFPDINEQSNTLEFPENLRCSAYTLNLCVTADANKVLQNKDNIIAHIHNSIINKCNNLWNYADHSKTANIIYTIVGHSISKPENDRWKSFYDALKQVLSIQDKSVQLQGAMTDMVNDLNADDFQYINEHLHCSKPIAEALDILQGDKDLYFGILLPCLLSLRKKLERIKEEPLRFCKELATAYLESVNIRFGDFFDLSTKLAQNAAVAAMSYPRFKDKWLTCVNSKYHTGIKSIFKRAVVKEINAANERREEKNNKNEDTFFEFETDTSETYKTEDIEQVQQTSAKAIIVHYLADRDRDVSMLNRYPELKSVFREYNTPIPSSGPADRLFSHSTITNLPLLNQLSDEMFEKRLILKSNLGYSM